MRRLLLLPLLLLAGCAKPVWLKVPELSAPDFSSWFVRENLVGVEEVAQALNCKTAGGESQVTLLPDTAALKAWAANRGVELVSSNGKPLPATPYAVVELGQREHGGYGLAISRQGGLRSGTLLLKGTFFEAKQGRWATADPISPCSFVSLPQREFSVIKVLDQNGAVRAATEGRGS